MKTHMKNVKEASEQEVENPVQTGIEKSGIAGTAPEKEEEPVEKKEEEKTKKEEEDKEEKKEENNAEKKEEKEEKEEKAEGAEKSKDKEEKKEEKEKEEKKEEKGKEKEKGKFNIDKDFCTVQYRFTKFTYLFRRSERGSQSRRS